MKKMSAIALVTALLATPVAVLATETTEAEKPTAFEQLDQNNDGKISAVEAKDTAPLVQQFEELDVNKDGYLTEAEFSLIQTDTETTAYLSAKNAVFTL
ncbi:hypothetical protein IOQ59_14875 [Pontibacterium sp. N1Y112]|uniref:EF-hand domain-containing protein n=1 Tax=Pontibacterium sinense TaxID=2781979 RepID=A0A8J7JZA0_9GAMM|nr:hypothetical protein [Pontibacterium sinense]MBE9398538.1 hypothetical protein [Pontibacterium sinense]